MKIFVFTLMVALSWGMPAEKPNPMINEGFFEGDIKGRDPNQDRNAIPRDNQRWTNGVVPYVIDSALYDDWDLIMKSIQHIQENSCIRFTQRKHEKDYVKMIKGKGCWSLWGRIGEGEQELSLGEGCDYFGTVVHELLHALGFEHEHNRSDRDDHLNILWGNIKKEWQYAFDKLEPHENRLLTGFDFDSVMLYGETSFAKGPGLKSMVAKDGRYMPEPFDKDGMSASDIKRLNMLYGC